MAGNSQSPDHPEDQTPKPSGPKVKTFACSNCGASVTIRNPGQSMSVVCESCHSVIDATDENYRILAQYQSKTKLFSPLIPLGSRGQLAGQTWEVIGYMVRKDEASGYPWDEYLLFNPYHGYRWLTESSGHWNLVKAIKEKPEIIPARFSPTSAEQAKLDEKLYRIFYKGRAVVLYVLGEFYWKVKLDDKVRMADFILPPHMLSYEGDVKPADHTQSSSIWSYEEDGQEAVWTMAEYVPPAEISRAFQLKQKLPEPAGIAPNQFSEATADWKQIAKLWMAFLLFLTVAQTVHVCGASNKQAYGAAYTFQPNTKSANTITTPVFTLNKDVSNLKIYFQADVDNDWFYVSGELVNNSNGQTYPFEKTVEYYHGYSDGEYWSEGGRSNELLISSVPGGNYYLNLDTESGSFRDNNPRQFVVMVKSDVPTYANYFWCVFFISILPTISWLNSRRDEIARWSQSDFSPYASTSS